MRKSVLTLAAIATLLMGTVTALQAEEFPVTVVDDRGIAATIAQQPQRVTTLGLFGLDVAQKLGVNPVGITTIEGSTPLYLGDIVSNAVDLGVVTQPSLERMTELNTDLVIGLRRYTEAYADDFADMGADFIAFDSLTYEDSKRATIAVSTALGFEDAGFDLNDDFDFLVSEYNQATKDGPSAIFIWFWVDTMYAYYDHSMPATFIAALNGTNVMGANPNPMLKANFGRPVSFEELLGLNPDMLFVFNSAGNSYDANPAMMRLDAVKNGQAWHVGFQFSQPTGPIARELVFKEMAHLMYPDQFDMPEMPEGAAAVQMIFDK